jgi:hypothetical protein
MEELTARLSPGLFQGKCEVKANPEKGTLTFVLSELVVLAADDVGTFKKPSDDAQQIETFPVSANIGGDGKSAINLQKLKAKIAFSGKSLGLPGTSKTSDILSALNNAYVEFKLGYDKVTDKKTGQELVYSRVTWTAVSAIKAKGIV